MCQFAYCVEKAGDTRHGRPPAGRPEVVVDCAAGRERCVACLRVRQQIPPGTLILEEDER